MVRAGAWYLRTQVAILNRLFSESRQLNRSVDLLACHIICESPVAGPEVHDHSVLLGGNTDDNEVASNIDVRVGGEENMPLKKHEEVVRVPAMFEHNVNVMNIGLQGGGSEKAVDTRLALGGCVADGHRDAFGFESGNSINAGA